MRLVEGVKVAVAIKTYPDGKLTGKIRCDSSAPIAEKIAGYFGGGGHFFAAGFRTYDMSYEDAVADFTRLSLLPCHKKDGESDYCKQHNPDTKAKKPGGKCRALKWDGERCTRDAEADYIYCKQHRKFGPAEKKTEKKKKKD